jgi:hypothetical protein
MTYVNLGARYPNHTFTGVVFSRSADAVGDLKQYDGKDVTLTGKIELSPDKKPQIVLNNNDQIRLASAAPSPAPAPATTPMPAPTAPGAIPASELPGGVRPKGRIGLANGWNSPVQGGELTRKDLAKLFGASGQASESLEADTTIEVYPGLPFLSNLAVAKKVLNLDGASASSAKISTPGLPQGSLNAIMCSGVFAGGFNKLVLITDNADQVISVLAMDANPRTRTPNEPDTTGYHTYNFITGRARGTNDIVIRHQITPGSNPNVVIVDTMLVDPNDPETPAAKRPTKSSSSKFGSNSKPKTGKVMERSRWFVPVPLVNLILRCVVR